MAYFGHSGTALTPTWGFSAQFRGTGWRANQRENGLEALALPLRGETGLRFLPGQRVVFDNGARQEEHPVRQPDQLRPGVAGFGTLKARQGPTQGFFTKACARLDRPAMDVGAPDGVGGNRDVGRAGDRWQPGIPDRFGRLCSFPVYADAHDIIDQVGRLAFVEAVPALQAHFSEALVFQFLLFVGRAPGGRSVRRGGVAAHGVGCRAREQSGTGRGHAAGGPPRRSASPVPGSGSPHCRIFRPQGRYRGPSYSALAVEPVPEPVPHPLPVPSCGWRCAAYPQAATSSNALRHTIPAESAEPPQILSKLEFNVTLSK